MIALIKRGKIDKTIKLFDNYYEGGKWSDENIKQDFEKFYFQKVGWLKEIWFKIINKK